tara:strand:- start:8949 stop:10136 length:1188 start_codon:yes stop_codon:yes gene_type:complete
MLLTVLVFAASAQAETAQDLLNAEVNQQPKTIGLNGADDYKAERITSYGGRNNNRAEESLSVQSKSGNNISRNISVTSNKKSAQVESFESTAGELVQKVEDDRLKKSKKHEDAFQTNKTILQNAYDITSSVDINNLGSEQDPALQNAFKCSNIVACNEDNRLAKNGTDSHDIKETCSTSQRLHWNGRSWSCIGIFEKPKSSNCSADQYDKKVNGGTACINYIYEWIIGDYGPCEPDNTKEAPVNCYAKKTLDDKDPQKTSSGNCLGARPSDSVVLCTYESYRDVIYTCPSGYSKIGASCQKAVTTCKYSSNSYCLVLEDGSGKHVSNKHCKDNGATHSIGGTYTKGAYKEVGYDYPGDLWDTYYEVCKASTQTIAATKSCPSGYAYDSKTGKCKK